MHLQFPPPPESVGLLLTYRCSASCSNCCFKCTPQRKEELSINTAFQVINELGKIESVKSITLSGGECFLRYDDMLKIVKRAHVQGLAIKCVTNAYWATSLPIAIEQLNPLVQAGMTILEVSTDDFHIKHVPLKRVANALEAAHALGLETHLIVVYDNKTRRLGNILHELNLSFTPSITREFPVIPVGNAEASIEKDRLISNEIHTSMPCREILCRPSITPNGEVFACCAVAGFINPLKLGVIGDLTLSEMFEESRFNTLYIILSLFGPSKLASIASKLNILTSSKTYVNECHLCHDILNDEKIMKQLNKSLEDSNLYFSVYRDYLELYLNSK